MLIPAHRAPTHPGELLRGDYLPELKWTAEEFAGRLRLPLDQVQEIIGGRGAVTPDVALRLGRLFDQSPSFWMNLQQAYDLYLASQSTDDLDQIEPVAPLRKAG